MSDELDDLDRQILDLLAGDGRTPATQIAEKIGLSRPAVADRIEKLERRGVIRGTTVVIDPQATGRTVTAFVSARRTGSLDAKARRAMERLADDPQVLEVHTVAGDDCYLFKIRTRSMHELSGFVNTLASAPLSLATRTTIVMETHFEKIGGVTLVGGRPHEA